MYKNPPLGFLMLFCHVFIDAPEKLPKFGAFSTLGTALVYSVQCTVYSVQCTVYSVQCTVYTAFRQVCAVAAVS